ncbi:hypothetical protein A9Q81_26790 [Gammaproteobacteria bacterium 42_54_T18]|nr:hypothetical protein A9Q81_26790 [Gammaproteobacteria bacterium 42_54_T18]
MSPIIGLNIFRAVAVIMMIIAHSIRIQGNFTFLLKHPDKQTFWDQCLLFFIQVEPIISAQFLFISGFSLTLSLSKVLKTTPISKRRWLFSLSPKLILLYLVSVIFFIGDNGIQLPDLFVSSGILSIIAISMALTGSMLITPKPIITLTLAIAVVTMTAFVLEQSKTSIIGLNAGAGGAIPLISMTFIGAIIGILYQRFHNNGLFAAAAVGCFIGLLSITSQYPWTVDVKSEFLLFYGDPVTAVLHSIQHALGIGDLQPTNVKAHFWNHSSIFLFRTSGGLTFILVVFMLAFANSSNSSKVTRVLNNVGKYALFVYIFHLVLLGVLEVTGIKPTTGWQTWLLVVALVLLGATIIQMRNKSDGVRRKLLDSFDPGTQ